MRHYLSFLLRWGVLGATGIFLGRTLFGNWGEVRSLQLQNHAVFYCAIALGVAMLAQLLNAVLWGWTLSALKAKLPIRWTMVTFLKNSPAKYVPGSVWHMYGRVIAAREKGIGVECTTLSVVIEPVFSIAGAMGIALLHAQYPSYQVLFLGLILLALHPRVLAFVMTLGGKLRRKPSPVVMMDRYPIHILIGATLFMAMRGLTFLLVVLAFSPIQWQVFRPLVSNFSFAWLLGMVLPTPGGLGVFETSALQMLNEYLTPALLLGAIALYRFVNISAEAIGAGAAYLVRDE
jgi:glycosyltransferase 2 family protein